MRRLALRLVGAGIVFMHGELLWRRLADGSLAELGVGARWLASGMLIAALVVVYRRHGRLFRGREAAVVWTLIALLHALSGVPGIAMLAEPAPWLIVPIAILAARSMAAVLVRSARPDTAAAARGSWRGARLAPRGALAGTVGSRAPPR